jgi:cytochrome P450 / NADPH-cytochrome P450 reductase
MANEVPGPRAWPFIGNFLDLRQGEFPLMALNTLADQYGPIYRIVGPLGSKRLIVSSQKLVNELCDESRFQKQGGPPGGQGNNRNGGASGLFFARNDDPDWGQAHRILMPAFGPLNIKTMFDGMSPWSLN